MSSVMEKLVEPRRVFASKFTAAVHVCVFPISRKARKQESKRAREQESKRAREQESKRAREQESKRAREQEKVGFCDRIFAVPQNNIYQFKI